MAFEIVLIVFLILVNGLLAMSELAVVSSRTARLQPLAEGGNTGARIALRLVENPGRFLATVQIGITLVGIFAGAFGGATIAARLGPVLNDVPAIAPHGDTVAFALVVVAITYLSLILGELVPKRVALTAPERVASLVAPPMRLLSAVAAPAVWLLDASSGLVLKILRVPPDPMQGVSEEEVRAMIAEGTRSGVFEPKEREMIDGVLRLADRTVRAVMTPRADVVWIDREADERTLGALIDENRVSRILVCEGTVDTAVGVLRSKDALAALLGGHRLDIAGLMMAPLVVTDRLPVLRLIELFRKQQVHLAVVVDEYGTTEGIVTPTDILEAVAGDMPERGEDEEAPAVRRADGSWLIDGMMPIDDFERLSGLRELSAGEGFYTVAGFVLTHLGHLPEIGERFAHEGWTFEVVDMDGRRIDRIMAVPPQDPSEREPGPRRESTG